MCCYIEKNLEQLGKQNLQMPKRKRDFSTTEPSIRVWCEQAFKVKHAEGNN